MGTRLKAEMTEAPMPLTLTLSPQAGRGDVPKRGVEVEETVRHISFSPPAGRRWRQPDEGPPPG
ncbi:hypothetical protein B5K08_31335 [Rhizobium leguminosarum bv. trifolii]|uniref:Uncharacterized protein n=1 Tax=Rhizobium leguminosarum bv. trifolii TaxID=386 RepID=A0A3E1B077_RHILT|nr:hypothetical protein ATY75_12515 [Rhizobium sp. N122]RFB82197.1 hypothetical protein B5K10_31330 [Rhizobium leguminosarum bv. trifolii]RFB82702.1 hypothetical protein B5K08_31335 [Rhizobium leguminosarum bv. trifolii]